MPLCCAVVCRCDAPLHLQTMSVRVSGACEWREEYTVRRLALLRDRDNKRVEGSGRKRNGKGDIIWNSRSYRVATLVTVSEKKEKRAEMGNTSKVTSPRSPASQRHYPTQEPKTLRKSDYEKWRRSTRARLIQVHWETSIRILRRGAQRSMRAKSSANTMECVSGKREENQISLFA